MRKESGFRDKVDEPQPDERADKVGLEYLPPDFRKKLVLDAYYKYAADRDAVLKRDDPIALSKIDEKFSVFLTEMRIVDPNDVETLQVEEELSEALREMIKQRAKPVDREAPDMRVEWTPQTSSVDEMEKEAQAAADEANWKAHGGGGRDQRD